MLSCPRVFAFPADCSTTWISWSTHTYIPLQQLKENLRLALRHVIAFLWVLSDVEQEDILFFLCTTSCSICWCKWWPGVVGRVHYANMCTKLQPSTGMSSKETNRYQDHPWWPSSHPYEVRQWPARQTHQDTSCGHTVLPGDLCYAGSQSEDSLDLP